jgi:hypothetical protein
VLIGKVKLQGGPGKLAELMGLLDESEFWFDRRDAVTLGDGRLAGVTSRLRPPAASPSPEVAGSWISGAC